MAQLETAKSAPGSIPASEILPLIFMDSNSFRASIEEVSTSLHSPDEQHCNRSEQGTEGALVFLENLTPATAASFTASQPEPDAPNLLDSQFSRTNLVPPIDVGSLLSTAITEQGCSPLETMSVENGWNIPTAIANELVALYFDKIHIWVPIIHRPSFYEKFMTAEGQRTELVNSQQTTLAETFMINTMFAIAARFSSATIFGDTVPVNRGEVFVETAATIKDGMLKTLKEPSLEFMKGCVLLAFYHCGAGQIGSGSLLTSVCVRLAYDIGLDEIDEDQVEDENPVDEAIFEDMDAWVQKEELRRLWWSIWELDTFVATLSRQPYGIERGQMNVFLPVSDHNWFSKTPTRSAFLGHKPDTVWKSLQNCPNQAARAWYLISNYLMSCIAHIGRQSSREGTTKSKEPLESSLCCFKLSLPLEFQLESLYINGQNIAEGNWIISTHLMIIASETILERIDWPQSLPHDNPLVNSKDPTNFRNRISSYLVHIGQVWPSEAIPLSNPIMCCCLVCPGTTEVRKSDIALYGLEVSTLLLNHYARYWQLGSAMLQLFASVQQGLSPNSAAQVGPKEREMIRRFSILLPPPIKKRKRSNDAQLITPPAANVASDDNAVMTDIFPNFELDAVNGLQWPFELLSPADDSFPMEPIQSIQTGGKIPI